MKKRHEQKLVILGIATFVILNIPFLFIFDVSGHFFGVPILYLSIFLIWMISIIISYTILKRHYE
ncbi:MAG: hypothetical protein HKP48_05010 [Winogradskyella sp.]|uniref:hypothetical protein n=1 Tax=Winogradskyella sp. TaxID=1883156 RepID=UPI0017D1BD05|nr:hypothetical protein [Winogradskyella sp.]MBT8246124.1 hypothetical protein [Winogradskyella sp.]NNK22659.1 hypothetical protein [Winogradskyella sp.]